MKTPVSLLCALFLAGCAGLQPSPSLTPERATALALRLANDKAAKVYHCQPFQASQPARWVEGRWVWTNLHGLGRGDLQATVVLAPDGSTHTVDLKVLDNANLF